MDLGFDGAVFHCARFQEDNYLPIVLQSCCLFTAFYFRPIQEISICGGTVSDNLAQCD